MHKLNIWATNNMDPELIQDRWDLWKQVPERVAKAPDWMTLMPHAELRHFEGLLKNDLKVDQRALVPFLTLVRKGELGYSEACRVLYHGLKDKKAIEDPEDPRYHRDYDDPAAKSKWFKKAAEEALEALDNQEAWNTPGGGPYRSYKGHGKGQGPRGNEGTSGSSSSSTNPWANWVPRYPVDPSSSSSSSRAPPPAPRTGWRPAEF